MERVGRKRGGRERVREKMQKGEEEKETCSQHIVHHKLIGSNDTTKYTSNDIQLPDKK